MLCRFDMPFRMRHQAEDATGRVAHSGNVLSGAVRVPGIAGIGLAIGADVSKDNHIPPIQLVEYFLACDELAFCVCHRDVNVFARFHKCAVRRSRPQVDPSVLKAAAVVLRQCRLRFAVCEAGQQPRLHDDLKAVAYAKDQLAFGNKAPYFVSHSKANLIGQQLARGNVIAVAEPSGYRQNLRFVEAAGVLHKTIHVYPRCLGAASGERILGFNVAIRARGSQYNHAHGLVGSHRGTVSGKQLCRIRFRCSAGRRAQPMTLSRARCEVKSRERTTLFEYVDLPPSLATEAKKQGDAEYPHIGGH